MGTSQKCEGCNNTADWLTQETSRAYYLCLADIGETWFKEYGHNCLACALLAEADPGRPASYLELQRRFSLLTVEPADRGGSASPVADEGNNGFT